MSLKDFVYLGDLGEGSYGQVIKVRRTSDKQIYAIKKVKLNPVCTKDIENALNEIRILASIKDPNIISYKETFYQEDIGSLCVVMEFADEGDLQGKIDKLKKKDQRFPEPEVWETAQHLARGLKTLQEYKIIHRDIKCANIFFSNGMAKLGDMNVSKITESQMASTQTGTPYYASPEVWRNQVYSFKSDIWSLGCVLYEMCFLSPPFKANNLQILNRKIQQGKFSRIPSMYSHRLSAFINMCLTVDVNKRADVDRLLRILNCDNPKTLCRSFSARKMTIDQIMVPEQMSDLNKLLPKPNYKKSKESWCGFNVLDQFLRGRTPERPVSSVKHIKSQQNLRSPRMQRAKPCNQPVSLNYIPDISESHIANLIKRKQGDIKTLRRKAAVYNKVEKPATGEEGGLRKQKLSLVNIHYGYTPKALQSSKCI